MIFLLAFVFVLVVQDTSATEYICNYQMDLCGCSRQPVITKKTFGAEDAKPNSWGWVVSLHDSNGHFCTGSILSEWYIITAAQCFETRMHMLSSITFCAGTNHILSCPQRRSIQQVITNFAYSNGTLKNDIAIVLVDIPFKFTNKSIARICLPNITHDNEYPQAGTNVISIGWGKNKTNSKLDRLQQITLQVMNKSADKCRSSLTNNHLQLCAAASREGIIHLLNCCLSVLVFIVLLQIFL
jgi:secreted trypsin-like serine protease